MGTRRPMGPKDRNRRTVHLLLRDGMHCWLCGALFTLENRPTIDHVVPHRFGGADSLDNLKLACQPCNKQRDTDYEV